MTGRQIEIKYIRLLHKIDLLLETVVKTVVSQFVGLEEV